MSSVTLQQLELPYVGVGTYGMEGLEGLEREILGTDERIRVRNTTAAPYRYICNIVYQYPFGRRAMCSGTLIGPRTVLTAGHCLVNKRPGRLTVVPGRDMNRRPFGSSRVVKVELFPGFRSSTRTDLGLITLEKPLGNKVGWWSSKYRKRQGDSIGTSFMRRGLPIPPGGTGVNVSGYPADKPAGMGCATSAGIRRRCFITALNDPRRSLTCGTEPWRSYDRLIRRRDGLLEYISDTCPGHSGSPLWIRRHPSMGGRVLVGVHIAGDDSLPGSAVANRGVELGPAVRRWIRRGLR